MSASPKPETGTAVARQRPGEESLSRDQKQHLAQIRQTRALTVAITNEAWGTALTPQMRHAVAEYMRRNRLDVSEVDILGGRIYRNGYYYRRRVAEMRSRGMIEWTEGEHIGPSVELEKAIKNEDPEIATWAKAEYFRRLKERIRWEVPMDATHAYVVRVKLKTDGKVLEGCDWITPERKKVTKWGEKVADPVGAEEPEKTVITRAWRRCGLLVAAEIPSLKSEEAVLDAEAEVVEETIERTGDEERAREIAGQHEPQMLAASTEPYGDVMPPAVPTKEAVRVDGSQHKANPAALAFGSALKDPYADEDEEAPAIDYPLRSPESAPVDDFQFPSEKPEATAQTTEPKLVGAGAFVLTFSGKAGTPIGELSEADLAALYAWAKRQKSTTEYAAFIEAAEFLMEERRMAAAETEGRGA
jgi:hypothetical protein